MVPLLRWQPQPVKCRNSNTQCAHSTDLRRLPVERADIVSETCVGDVLSLNFEYFKFVYSA